MKKHILAIVAIFMVALFQPTLAQTGYYKPGQIAQKLKKLNVLGTVLYVAAHPDDENTRLITYYANEALLRTGYLSATRGDGGQNLIGSEIREGLGIIRTQELLAARRIDGGLQFFSRANDFGYSKNPDETFNIWNRDQVLADFVWTIRNLRPDVLITRFDANGISHGHHTASAILAREAFDLAGDPEAFPEQLEYVEVWQPKKIFWNVSWWHLRGGADTTGLMKVEMGGYNPLLGASYGEIAAQSRSMHKSQGFGSSGSRGNQTEFLRQLAGPIDKSPFGDLDFTWSRVEGSNEVEALINQAIKNYDPSAPWKIASLLLQARDALDQVEDDFWRKVKRKELDEIIVAIGGIYASLSSDATYYTPGDSLRIDFEVINRSPLGVKVEEITFSGFINPVPVNSILTENRTFRSELNFVFPESTPYSTPYWLKNPAALGMYDVPDQKLIGKAENSPVITGKVNLSIEGREIDLDIPVFFRSTDPVIGEVKTPLVVGPEVTLRMKSEVLVFGTNEAKTVEVELLAGKKAVNGILKLQTPEDWKISPETISFRLSEKGETQAFAFEIQPPGTASAGTIKAEAVVKDVVFTKEKTTIDYAHIPSQTTFSNAEAKVIRLDLERKGNMIGYIVGAGDAIPQNLEEVGYRVETLSKDQIVLSDLKKYDAIVLGARAFNTQKWLSYKNEVLFDYVKQGGTLISQYHKSYGLVTPRVAPFDLRISRDRVTVEEAPVRFLQPEHPVLNYPNKITEQDFQGWVQERGLYFANQWSDEFVPILSSNDPGESEKKGGLLVAKYGEGFYVYAAYSWFRELPAGVPGAYRLFVNLLSLGNE
ncbi:MAG: PIG-L family deacetylase [Bacteroidota bacterium]